MLHGWALLVIIIFSTFITLFWPSPTFVLKTSTESAVRTHGDHKRVDRVQRPALSLYGRLARALYRRAGSGRGPGCGATAHSDALAPHKDEAREAEDAKWDPDDDEDAPSHDEEEQHADNDEEEDAPTPDVAEATAEKAAADHDPGTDDCFSGD